MLTRIVSSEILFTHKYVQFIWYVYSALDQSNNVVDSQECTDHCLRLVESP